MPLRMSVAHATLYIPTHTHIHFLSPTLSVFFSVPVCLHLSLSFFHSHALFLVSKSHTHTPSVYTSLGIVCSGAAFFYISSQNSYKLNDGLFCLHKFLVCTKNKANRWYFRTTLWNRTPYVNHEMCICAKAHAHPGTFTGNVNAQQMMLILTEIYSIHFDSISFTLIPIMYGLIIQIFSSFICVSWKIVQN